MNNFILFGIVKYILIYKVKINLNYRISEGSLGVVLGIRKY